MNLTLQQLIGDFADLETRAKTALAGIKNATPAVINNAIETAAADLIAMTVAAELEQGFSEVLETQTAINGERVGNGVDPEEWESQVDDAVCELLEQGMYKEVLGSGYIGVSSVDTRLHEPDRPAELAKQIAAQFAKDIVKRDRETIHGFVTLKADAPGTLDANEIGALRSVVLIVVANYIRDQGEALDLMRLAEDLDLASDEDDALALGAMQRIASKSVNQEEIRRSLKAVRAAGGAEWADEIMREADAMASKTPEEPAKPKRTRKKKEPNAETVAALKEAEAGKLPSFGTVDALIDSMSDEDRAFLAEMEGTHPDANIHDIGPDVAMGPNPDYVPPSIEPTPEEAMQILLACKEHLPLSEKALAEVMGFSRATLNNICAGKSKLTMTEEQTKALSGAVRSTYVALADILQTLDGGV